MHAHRPTHTHTRMYGHACTDTHARTHAHAHNKHNIMKMYRANITQLKKYVFFVNYEVEKSPVAAKTYVYFTKLKLQDESPTERTYK